MEYLKENNQNDEANQLMEAMYKEYFEKAQNINSEDFLSALAKRTIGLDVEKAREVMQNGLRLEDIKQKDRAAKTQMRVTGVPFFIIQSGTDEKARPVAFSGAQPVDLIAEVLEDVSGA